MKIEVLRNDKDLLEFKLAGERHTFPGLLRQKLLANKDVDYVSYILEHPTADSARFVLRSSKAKRALEEAAKEIEADLDDFSSKLKKAMK